MGNYFSLAMAVNHNIIRMNYISKTKFNFFMNYTL